jgi:hypothetical protein
MCRMQSYLAPPCRPARKCRKLRVSARPYNKTSAEFMTITAGSQIGTVRRELRSSTGSAIPLPGGASTLPPPTSPLGHNSPSR